LSPNNLLNILFWNTLSLSSSLNVSDLSNRTITLLVSESVGLSVRPVRHYVIGYSVGHFVTRLVTQSVGSLVPTYYTQARHHADSTVL
jgi:hypothetical protein